MVNCFVAEGVEVVFGNPGEENYVLFNAIADSIIRFITHSIRARRAFMADVYDRLTGRMGVCMATLGPGATKLSMTVRILKGVLL